VCLSLGWLWAWLVTRQERKDDIMSEVYVLEFEVPYEDAGIVDVYDSMSKAERRKKKIERACKHYHDETECTDYKSDIDMPDYYGDVLAISSWTVK